MPSVQSKEILKGPPFAPALPHVVVLGAGASKAAFPQGDKNGKLIPIMDELPDVLGKPWENLVNQSKPPVQGFEAQFSWLRQIESYSSELRHIEALISEYFRDLALPDHPTIYDYLVLGLRPKDVIATFNWDPFLMLSHRRNRAVAELPDVRFLHGSVAYATCVDHDILGSRDEMCPHCHRELVHSTLFFPDDDKDYAANALVQRDWDYVAKKLKRAFHLTIFGYSGPQTDYKAKQLLLEAWSATGMQSVSHVEIIDVKDESDLREHWRDFIPFHHDMITPNFWSSTIARWPRRTAEYKIRVSHYGIPSEYLGPFRSESLRELQDWHSEIAATEKQSG